MIMQNYFFLHQL